MAYREPIPSEFDINLLPRHQTQFHTIEDVDRVVQSLIWNVSQERRYTGPGCIQEELFRNYPAVYTFLRTIGRNPETIPRLLDHKREIQRVNTQLWAYATTHNVITLKDMEHLIELELPTTHHLLGPITALPAAREICQTSSFEERVENCFRNGYQPAELCMTNENVLQAMYDCICLNRYRMPGTLQHSTHGQAQWWESVFAHHMLLHMGCPSVPRTLSRGSMQTFSLRDLAPYGIRINGFPALIKNLISMIRPENLTKSNQVAQRCLDEEVRKLYEQFSEEFFVSSVLNSLKRNPVKVLRHLAKCASRLHAALKQWAESRGCAWPDGYLDSLLLFGEFVDRVASQGPFRSLLHLVLSLSNRGLPNFDQLITEITRAAATGAEQPAVVVDLTDSPCTPVDPDGNDQSDKPYSDFLADLVKQFNAILNDQGSSESETVWQALVDLEQKFQHQDTEPGSSSACSRTLIRWLAEAAQKSVPELSKTLNLGRFVEDTANAESASEGQLSEADASRPLISSAFNPTVVCEFVRKLTWPRERSRQDVVRLVSSTLRIPCSDQLDQLVGTELAQLNRSDGASREPVLYHEYLKSVDLVDSDTASVETASADWSIRTSLKLSQRDGVLSFLATCPPLVDMESWSQWRVPGILLDLWGELDHFLMECGAEKVCEQFNLVGLRLLRGDGGGGGLLRLTSSAAEKDLDRLFSQWSDNRIPSTTRALCDVLIGSLLQINGLPVSQLKSSLSKRLLTQVPGTPNWFDLLVDLQLFCPNALLGPLFSKVLVPCLDQSGIRPASSWPNDLADVIPRDTGATATTFLDRLLSQTVNFTEGERSVLVSAIGNLGLQLQWPAFVRFFECHRLESPQSEQDVRSGAEMEPTQSVRTPALRKSSTQAVDSTEVSPQSQKEAKPATDDQQKQLGTKDPGVFGTPAPTERPASPSTCLARREFIHELRRREFGCGANLSEEAADLVRRVEGKLARSLVQLSEDLYGAPGHFLLELIQNADDNLYRSNQLDGSSTSEDDELPTVEFCAVTHTGHQGASVEPKSALLIMNNESVGFTENDIASLCDIGVSTKAQERDSKTGRKGIGFKSVFNVSDAPEVHSNGFHVRFHRQSRQSTMTNASTDGTVAPPSLLIPEWCDTRDGASPWPVPCPVPEWCTTLFVLPLTAKSNAPGLQLSSVIQFTRETVVPSVMLFLRRLRRLKFSCSSGSEESGVQNLRTQLLSLTRATQRLFPVQDSTDAIGQTAELISVTEHEWDYMQPAGKESTTVHRWFCFRERLLVDAFSGLGTAPKHTEIAIAISLTDVEPLPKCPIFAYLPVRESGFSFYINADFDLTSSREDVDGTSAWNQWLVGQIPSVFAHMIQRILELYQQTPVAASDSFQSMTGLSQNQFLGRLLSCMPCQLDPNTMSQSASTHYSCGGLFYGLPAQIRLRLGKLSWLPVSSIASNSVTDVTYAAPNRMLLAPSESEAGESKRSSCRPFHDLTRLLVDRLGMHEPHPDLLTPNNSNMAKIDGSDDDAVAVDHDGQPMGALHRNMDLQSYWVVGRIRREALLWLGVQTISVDSLLELASNLGADEWRRPGLLSVLLTSLEAAITSHIIGPRGNQLPHNAVHVLRRRVLSALRHLPIFPLTSGDLVRLGNPPVHPLRADLRLPVLLPPSPTQLANNIDLTYDDYIQLLTKLGPLIDPCAIEYTTVPHLDNVRPGPPNLLVQPNPEGLELKIASPEVVLIEWILPALEQHQVTHTDHQQDTFDPTAIAWLLSVGQLYASVICLSDCPSYIQLPVKLPIVTRDRQGRDHVAPPLASTHGLRRDCPIFLPPTSFTICPTTMPGTADDLETKLFQFLLEQLDDSDPVRLISMAYFTGPLSTESHGYRWFQLFSEAGVCTLLSVHSIRYRVTGHELASDTGYRETVSEDDPLGLPLLPSGHRLRSNLLEALHANGLPMEAIQLEPRREWIVEDFVSPGLELLLSWIGRLAGKPEVIEVSYQLAALLHDNWSAFERVEQAGYMIKTPGDSGGVMRTDQSRRQSSSTVTTTPIRSHPVGPVRPLGPARWLTQLRNASWLPVLENGVESKVRLVSPALQAPIYSPVAFIDLNKRHDEELHALLQRACRVWVPGPYISQNPPTLMFTKALGMAVELERSAFEYLMKSLAASEGPDGAPHHIKLTPDFMFKIYQTAVRCCCSPEGAASTVTSDQNDSTVWLRSVFATPDYPCILVRCPADMNAESGDSASSAKRARFDRLQSSVHGPHPNRPRDFCPICTEQRPVKQPIAIGSKRRSLESTSGSTGDGTSDPVYHLSKPDRVCWIRALLPDQPSTERTHSVQDVDGSGDQREDDEEDEDPVDVQDDQCIFIPVNRRNTSRSNEHPFRSGDLSTISRVFALSDCYGSDSRSFFVDKLGIPFTSSLEEILSLRPDVDTRSTTRKQWCDFGRRLGQWYALLDHCLLHEAVPRTATRHPPDAPAHVNSRCSDLLQVVRNFPLLFGADGLWHKPSEIFSLILSDEDDVSESQNAPVSLRLPRTYLFAWTKPSYAQLVLHASEQSMNLGHVLAHSLTLLNARHEPCLASGSSRMSNPVLSHSGPQASSAHMEGTAHGLLLDVIGLPVIDRLAVLTLAPVDSVPRITASVTLPPKAVPCAPLTSFFDTFVKIVSLWVTALPSGSVELSLNSPSAFLVDHLTPWLQFRDNLPMAFSSTLKQLHLRSPRCLACVVDNRLYVDSTLGADIFARLASLPLDTVAPLIYLAVGFMDDPGLESVSASVATAFDGFAIHGLFNPLADFVCPTGGPNKVALTHFLRGFLNVIRLIVPDLTYTLGFGVSLSTPTALQQLQNYLTSHGIRKLPATRMLRTLCETREPVRTPRVTAAAATAPLSEPTTTTSSSAVSLSHQPNRREPSTQTTIINSTVPDSVNRTDATSTVVQSTHMESRTADSSPRATSTAQSEGDLAASESVPPARTESPSSVSPTRSAVAQAAVDEATSRALATETAQSSSYSVGGSTRSDTILGSLTAQSYFVRLPRDSEHSRIAAGTRIWSSTESLSTELSNRLSRMMANRTDTENFFTSGIGRLGELYVYHRLMELVRRHQERHSNFDQMVGLEFPTGHPILGMGRIVRCHWANADVESRRPFDLDIDVQVECDASQWDTLLEQIADDLSTNVVRIAQRPSFRERDHCKPGLLSVGPIFLEVKATAGSANWESSTTDLFEISMPELMCAAQQGWRYHLLRVIWERGSDGTPLLTTAPQIVHVPDLVSELRQQSSALRLCLAMLRATSSN